MIPVTTPHPEKTEKLFESRYNNNREEEAETV